MSGHSHRRLSLGVMAKYWEPGKVKTRLAVSIGDEKAALLHHAFCRHLASTLANAADKRSFVITPHDRAGQFDDILSDSWHWQLQSDGDLGCRMQTWFEAVGAEIQGVEAEECANQPSGDAVLIGADCPILTAEEIERAGAELQHHDVVLGPARDGGYYLIGFQGGWRSEYSVLFSAMPWSQPSLYEVTLERADRAGLSVASLSPMEDVDTLSELESLVARLKQTPEWHPGLCRDIDLILADGALG